MPSSMETASTVSSLKENTKLDAFRNKKKWVFLALLCFSQLGQLYNSQAMPTLQVPFEKEMSMNDLDYSHLVIAETLPGFIFPLIGGLFVDYFGASKSYLATNLFIILGQSLCTLATYQKSFWVFILGKVIFNSASEAATLARSKIVGIWYVNNDIGKALGAAVVLQTSAAIVCDLVYPNLYQYTNSLGFPFFVGVIVCVISTFICIRCVMVHKKLLRLKGNGSEVKEGNVNISIKAMKKFPPIIWLLLGAASFGVDSFIIVKLYLGKHLQTAYQFTLGEAGTFLAVSQVLTGFATPIAGFLTDRVGKLPIFLIMSIGLLQSGVFFSITAPRCHRCFWPAIPIALLSLGLGPLFVAGYSSLLRLVDEKELGLATALIPVIISAEMIIFAVLSGQIANATFDNYGYTWVFLMALIIGSVGLVIGIIAQFYDWRGEKKLQYKHKPRIEPSALLDIIDTDTSL